VSTGPQGHILAFGEFCLDARQRLLFGAGGTPVPLPSRAFDTLLFMAEHPDELLDKQRLMKAVWPNVVVEENNLNQNISLLRRALGEQPGEHRFIVTVAGRGFRFVPAVQRLSEMPQAQAAANAVQPKELSPPEPAVETGTPDRGRVKWIAFAAVFMAVAALLIIAISRWSSPPAPATASAVRAVPAGKPRIAILPFENLSPDPANAFFTDGLHEEIGVALAQKVPGLDVISRTTMMVYRRQPKSVAEIARELGATHVIEGSVRRETDQVRLTLQLIDTRTDDPVWAQNYDRTLANALTLQSEVAGNVASQLSLRLLGGDRANRPLTRDPEAFDYYLKGTLARGSLTGIVTPLEVIRTIDESMSAAIARDPSFAAAYAKRAGARMLPFIYNIDTSERQIGLIHSDLETAERLAPEDPYVLGARALSLQMVENDFDRALAYFARAEAAGLVDPPLMVNKGYLLASIGRTEEGIGIYERQLAIDPRNPYIIRGYAVMLSALRRPVEAVRALNLGIQQISDNAATLRVVRALLLFNHAGKALPRTRASLPLESTASLRGTTHRLLLQKDYADAERLLEAFPEKTGRSEFLGAGAEPVARLSGWTHMLLANRDYAASDGQIVLDFASRAKETIWNNFFLRLLAADAYVFTGDAARARTAARDALDLAQKTGDKFIWVRTAAEAARAYAWSGAEEEALALLEELSTSVPGLAPAEISRDPLYSVPLASNARYRALSARMEEQMRATKLE
jgi:TolB-like protein/DNA-binding winged helix-turn-helix (wHTH) protein